MTSFTVAGTADLHPLMVSDEWSEALGRQLHALAPGADLVDQVAAAGPKDWLCLCPGRTTDLKALLAMAHDRGLGQLVIDSTDQPAVDDWLLGRPAWRPIVKTLPDLAKRRGVLAHAFYGHPTSGMTVIAVTGTNGKSSVAHGLARCLAAQHGCAASIGTLGISLHRSAPDGVQSCELEKPELTSLPAVRLARSLAMLRDRAVMHVVLEASSIGLEQYRLAGCQLKVAALTNLSQDHLDYHVSLDAYAQAKALLFQAPGLQAVVAVKPNAAALPQAHWLFDQAVSKPADRQTVVVSAGDDGQLQVTGLSAPVSWSEETLGRHNQENKALAMGCLHALGIKAADLPGLLKAFALPKGRLEQVLPADSGAADGNRPLVYVDYAHTPDALAKVLEAVRPLADQRRGALRLVFGCGGDRDRGKRALMGVVAAESADLIWLTSDNPRSEDPMAIVQDILQGMQGCLRRRVVLDRAQAIAQAIATARPEDVIVIAGKGHESGQVIADRTWPFQDQDQAQSALDGWRANPTFDRLMGDLEAAGLLIPSPTLEQSGSWRRASPLGFCTDSRQLQPGDVFVALSGERFDGHVFCEAVVRAGAAALVVGQPVDLPAAFSHIPVIQVTEPQAALTQMASTWREAWAGELIAVVGSNGKTTVKEMMAAVLRASHGAQRVHATPGNLNNQIGVPLSLLGLMGTHRSAVIELGMNHPGEIDGLARLARPNLVVMTNAQREHQAFMKTVEACARENGQALCRLAPEGYAVLPMDAAHLPIWLDQLQPSCRLMLFGQSQEWTAAWQVLQRSAGTPNAPSVMGKVCFDSPATDRSSTRFVVERDSASEHHTSVLQGIGEHFSRNAAAVLAASQALAIPAEQALAALSQFEPMPGRGRIYRGSDFQLVDDSYNANPDSVRAAISGLAEQPPPRAIVLGDMGEVGELSDAFHDEVVQRAHDCGLERICLHGQAMSAAAQRSGVGEAFESIDLLADSLRSWIDEQAEQGLHPTVWVKGSRFMKMERVSKALQDWMTGHAARPH
ncbi:MAG: UDP-N-acetylmuramyl-tripeptide synthetase [Burkholderiaceae bacterium]